MKISPELSLLAKCASAYSDKTLFEEYAHSHNIHWDRFLNLISRHRVTPMVNKNLNTWQSNCVPKPILEKLKNRALKITQKSLMQIADLIQISKAFNENHIEHLCFKGPTLSQFLYDDPCLREFKDVDVLIKKHKLYHANKRIQSLKFKLTSFDPDNNGYLATKFLDWNKDANYINANSVVLELHWHLLKNLKLLHGDQPEAPDSFWQAPLTIKLYNTLLTSLSKDNLLIYLFAHGSYSGWARLHWLIDIYDFIKRYPPNWQNLMTKAKEFNATNVVIEGVTMANLFFNFTVPNILKDKDKHNRITKALIHSSLLNMDNKRLFYIFPQSKWRVHYRRLFLIGQTKKERFDYFFKSFTTSSSDWQTLPLPRFLFFLYYPLRPMLLLIRKLNTAKMMAKKSRKS